jgi:uncharacterized membrane protein
MNSTDLVNVIFLIGAVLFVAWVVSECKGIKILRIVLALLLMLWVYGATHFLTSVNLDWDFKWRLSKTLREFNEQIIRIINDGRTEELKASLMVENERIDDEAGVSNRLKDFEAFVKSQANSQQNKSVEQIK